MLSLVITIPTTAIADADARVNFYWNVDARGIAAGEVSKVRPIGPAQKLFTAGVSAGPQVRLDTQRVCFGLVKVASESRDSYDNTQSGSTNEAQLFVNSTPLPPTDFARGGYVAGQQQFSFTSSPQVG